jgi:CRP-like cAMP-binding protein
MSPEFVVSSRDPSADRILEVGAGEYVFQEGELGTDMFIIQEGRVEIFQTVGDRDRHLAMLERGDFFGEMSILEELPRNASARAATPSRLIVIDGATFDSMLRANPEIGVRIMRKLSRRVRTTDALLQKVLDSEEDRLELATKLRSQVIEVEPGPGCLGHTASSTVFTLPANGSVTIGRQDPVTGISPDIDLTSVDPERSSSRRHAKMYREGQTYLLVEDIGATNGTFLNGKRIRTGVPAEVKSGDQVRFGLVELAFSCD